MVIVSPVFAWYFLGPYIDSENYEKRDKGPRPVFTLQNYEAFPREWEAYYNDNIPFRNQLIRLNNSIDYYLFGQSSSGQVAIGKDGWLFIAVMEMGTRWNNRWAIGILPMGS